MAERGIALADIDELLARVAEGDEEAQAELKKLYSDRDKAVETQKQLRDRDKKIANDPSFREKFPRAMAAYDKGRLALPDDPSDEALSAALKAKEDELIDIGFEVPKSADAKAEGEASVEEKPDPAKAWEGTSGAHSPGELHPDDGVNEVEKAMTEPIGSREWANILYKANREGQQNRLVEIREAYQPDPHPDSVV